MRGDDRPRPSHPKHKRQAATETPALICARCRFHFPVWAVSGWHYTKTKKGDVVHVNPADCRAYILVDKLGVEQGKTPSSAWLFVRYPRERLLAEVDVRPKEWKRVGWMPRSELYIRVRALILYCSWCYPVCMDYAVQIADVCPKVGRPDEDGDEILRDEQRRPERLKEIQIARYMNEHQPSVARAIARLVAAKEIRIDEDRVITPAAKLLDMSISERLALYEQRIREVDDELRGVPKGCIPWIMRIQEEVPVDLSTVILSGVKQRCTDFRATLNDARSDLFAGIREECGRAAHLIPDLFEKTKPSSSRSSLPTKSGHPKPYLPQDADAEWVRNELYALSAGKQAMGKLPPQTERAATVIAAKLSEITGILEIEAAKLLMKKCKQVAPRVTPRPIAYGLAVKAAQARDANNPTGFLMEAVPKLFAGEGLADILAKIAAGVEPGQTATMVAKGGRETKAERIRRLEEEHERMKSWPTR